MFEKNQGNKERALRLIIGTILLTSFSLNWPVALMDSPYALVGTLVGAFLMLTGATGKCPVYDIVKKKGRKGVKASKKAKTKAKSKGKRKK